MYFNYSTPWVVKLHPCHRSKNNESDPKYPNLQNFWVVKVDIYYFKDTDISLKVSIKEYMPSF